MPFDTSLRGISWHPLPISALVVLNFHRSFFARNKVSLSSQATSRPTSCRRAGPLFLWFPNLSRNAPKRKREWKLLFLGQSTRPRISLSPPLLSRLTCRLTRTNEPDLATIVESFSTLPSVLSSLSRRLGRTICVMQGLYGVHPYRETRASLSFVFRADSISRKNYANHSFFEI